MVTIPFVDLRLSVTWGEAAISSLLGGTSYTTSWRQKHPQAQPSSGSTTDLRGSRGRGHLCSAEKRVDQVQIAKAGGNGRGGTVWVRARWWGHLGWCWEGKLLAKSEQRLVQGWWNSRWVTNKGVHSSGS